MDEQMAEKFEAWHTIRYGSAQLNRGATGFYSWNATEDRWQVWQAAALSQPAAQVDSSHSAGGECGGVQVPPIVFYHHAEADGTFITSESCICEDDVYTNNGDDESIGVPLVRYSDAIAAILAERESCAKLCDLNASIYHHQARGGDNSGASDHKETAAEECASDIRAKATP